MSRPKGSFLSPEVMKKRLRAKCLDHETGCWEWMGAVTASGRPVVSWQNRLQDARLALWSIEHPGEAVPVYARMTCGWARCMNPEHLEMAERADSQQDGCFVGHDIDEGKEPDGTPCRICRAKYEIRRSRGTAIARKTGEGNE